MTLLITFVLVIISVVKAQHEPVADLVPLNYNLHYIFKDPALESYTGEAAIMFKLIKDTDYLDIVYSGAIDHVRIKHMNDSTEVQKFNYSVNHDKHRVEGVYFKIDNVYEISLNFTQTEYGGGLEKTFDESGSPIVYTSDLQFGFPFLSSTRNRSVIFELKITHDSIFTAVSNTPGTSTIGKNANQTTTTFETTPITSPKLFGFILGKFKPRPIKNQRSFPLNFYGPESKIDHMFGQIFSEYENYFNCTIPGLKLDIISMSNSPTNYKKLGFILVEEKTFSYRIDPRGALAGINLISKAIGDQFIGIWNDTDDLNGLTSFLANKILWILEANIQDIITFENLHDVMVKEYSTLDFMARELAYHKSAAIYRMIEQITGPVTFQTCLQTALKSKKNFIKCLPEWIDAEINLTNFLNDWVNHKGYPIVTIGRNYENGELILIQNSVDPNSNVTWKIPYNFATKLNPSFNKTEPDGWMIGRDKQLILDVGANDWIVTNKQASGYYLVSYDEKNWDLIIEELCNGSIGMIHPLNRANLLTTGYILSLLNDFPESTLLSLISYLDRETDPRPWFVADNILEKLYKDSYGRIKSYREQLNDVILFITRNLYDNYTRGLNPFTRFIAMKWACRAGYRRCLKDFDQLSITYLESMENGTSLVIPSDMMDLMMCYGFRNESDYIKLYSYGSNEFHQMMKNRIDCHLDTNVFRSEFMKSFIFKMFNYRTYFDQLNWMEYLESVPGFNLRLGDLVFGVFEKNLNEFDTIYLQLRDTELELLPFKYISQIVARYKKQAELQQYEFNRTQFDKMVATVQQKYGEIAAESIQPY